jgi:Bacterial regulatory proteins, luxR family
MMFETSASSLALLVWSTQEGDVMRCFWEQTGVLGPIYRLVGQGLNNKDIAKKLGLTEANVQNCIAWVLHFLKLNERQELVLYASNGA